MFFHLQSLSGFGNQDIHSVTGREMCIAVPPLSLSSGMRNWISSAHEVLICHSSSGSTEQLLTSTATPLNRADLRRAARNQTWKHNNEENMEIIKAACTLHKGTGVLTVDMEPAPLVTGSHGGAENFHFLKNSQGSTWNGYTAPVQAAEQQRPKLCLTAISIALYASKLEDYLELQPQVVQMIQQ